jgi:hypothetical protein
MWAWKQTEGVGIGVTGDDLDVERSPSEAQLDGGARKVSAAAETLLQCTTRPKLSGGCVFEFSLTPTMRMTKGLPSARRGEDSLSRRAAGELAAGGGRRRGPAKVLSSSMMGGDRYRVRK